MLSESHLLERFAQHNVPLSGRKIVEAIRRGNPSRRVGGGKFNVACRYASKKMRCVIQAESHKNELPHVYIWDHDEETDEFYDQPSQIKLSYRSAAGRTCSHFSTPDYFLIQKNWMGWVECKTEEELLKREASGSELFVRTPEGKWRCPAGESFATQYGLGFRVISSKEIDWLLVRNINFLADYLDAACPVPDSRQQELIKGLFTESRWILLQTILSHPEVDADAVFKMVVDGIVHVDLFCELLAEPQYTVVCPDALSLAAYQGQKQLQTTTSLPDLCTVELKAGTHFLWDNQPWQVLNVGMTELFVVDQHKTCSTLPREVNRPGFARHSVAG